MPAQRRVMELFCAHAMAQGVFVGLAEASYRDIASHLYRTPDSGVSSAREALKGLVGRGVLERVGDDGEFGASEWAVMHWTRWRVDWSVHPASIADRMIAFAATEIRAIDSKIARVHVRAIAKSARALSQELEAELEEIRAHVDSRDPADNVLQTPQVRPSRLARSRRPHTVPLLDREESLPKEGREIDPAPNRAPAEFVAAFIQGCGPSVKYLAHRFSVELNQLAELAGEDGRANLLALCRSSQGPAGIVERLAWLRFHLEAPPAPRRPDTVAIEHEEYDPELTAASLEHLASIRQGLKNEQGAVTLAL